MSDIRTITTQLKEAALQLGFSAVGIARADVMSEETELFKTWLDRGYHGAMGYMERNLEKREDVRNILPGAKSVIVVAYNYFTKHHENVVKDEGKIARYAWGDDYHEVIPPKLEELSNILKTLSPGAETKFYTDTGAILEKQWARRAGIGWQGKNGNILNREIGSWFFLGVIITTTELEPDSPQPDMCGTCVACLKACPTQAIVEPRVVDATKCISYWTIEAKPDVEIPQEIAQNLNGWVFGCDICQEVCPWNRFEKPASEEKFQPRNNETTLSFKRIEEFVQEDFSARFKKSPLKRTKMAGLKRNARALKSFKN
ncbi:MAG: tRNA epoxyqueuosine(34) reductase QueG [Bacteroidota bacterium]